jgi:hypothetical protein
MIKDRIDLDLLERFENGLDPGNPNKSAIPARIIGYGEISTIFEIQDKSQLGLAYKRLPIFKTQEEMDSYEWLFAEYNRILREDIGIDVPPCATARIYPRHGNKVIYNIQEKLPEDSIGNKVIMNLERDSLNNLIRSVLLNIKKVWEYNALNKHKKIGLDGQISNWAVKGMTSSLNSNAENLKFIYIDTGTPLMRINGKEQLNTDLFLRSAPSFLIWLIKWLFLDEILDRYYDFHLVAVDLIANFYKEQRSEDIPMLIDTANSLFKNELADFNVKPITLNEVHSYYREDAFIWSLYLWMRRFDRFLHTKILRRPYPYILPGKITR